jgi:hypothetical protein
MHALLESYPSGPFNDYPTVGSSDQSHAHNEMAWDSTMVAQIAYGIE